MRRSGGADSCNTLHVAKDLASVVRLNDGVLMPLFGLGVYLAEGADAEAAVVLAFKNGYRLIDTAQYYRWDYLYAAESISKLLHLSFGY